MPHAVASYVLLELKIISVEIQVNITHLEKYIKITNTLDCTAQIIVACVTAVLNSIAEALTLHRSSEKGHQLFEVELYKIPVVIRLLKCTAAVGKASVASLQEL